jgi:ribosomal-protein-alanine N-acetyltransferase
LQADDYLQWRNAFLYLQKPKNQYDFSPRTASQLTKSKYRSILKEQNANRECDSYYDFAVFLKSNSTFIGLISVMNVSRGSFQNASFGYRLFHEYWGQGFGKEAAKAGIDIAFRTLKLHRLESGIEISNRPSIALAKSLKMRKEGIRKRYLYLGGRWLSLVYFAINCEEVGIRFQGKPESSARI